MYFVRGVRHEYSPNVARLALAFILTLTMCLTLLNYGAWYNGDLELAVLFTVISFNSERREDGLNAARLALAFLLHNFPEFLCDYQAWRMVVTRFVMYADSSTERDGASK